MEKFCKADKWEESRYGIWTSDDIDVPETVFSEEQQNIWWAIEDDSWWFQYRACIIIDLMKRFFDQESSTIDIGGGNGYTSLMAKKNGYVNMSILEPSIQGCINAYKRGHSSIYCGGLTEETLNDNSIEQALLLDVLEHIEDDVSFLDLLNKKMIRGGKVIITVPAFMCLWSSEDDAAGHFRRYRIADLCDLLEASGFDICYRSYFMGFLFLPILLIRVFLEKIGILKSQEQRTDEERAKIAKSQFSSRGGIVNIVLSVFEGIEKKLMKKERRVPFGSSIIVVARNRCG